MTWARTWLLAWLFIADVACASSAPAGSIRMSLASTRRANASEVRPERGLVQRDPRRSDLYVGCADRTSCPSGVGMLVVDDDAGPEPERCTATLIARDRVLTAVHCLASADRRDGSDCRHTWVSFPETADASAEWAACERVVIVSGEVNQDGLHQEHAVLQLSRQLDRTPLAIDPRPPEPNSIVQVISVTPHPIYSTTHELATRLCRAVDDTRAVAALGAAATHVGWLVNCPIARGNSGSPVVDRDGKIRAIVHGGTESTFEIAVTSGL